MNIDILKDNAMTRKYHEIMASNEYQILNKINRKYSTRIIDNSMSCLKNVCI